MGLDITAYTNLTADPDAPLEEWGEVDPETHWKCNSVDETEKRWPGRTAGLTEGTIYSFGDSVGFRAGSYSGYGAFRDWLARMAGYRSASAVWEGAITTGPFFELIHFSDCEGVIGPVVAAKLARDFADREADFANRCSADDDYYMGKYREWKAAFEMASHNGAVDFH